MKTIQLNEQILRVKDDVAEEKVSRYGWKYVPRSIWKEKVRDVKKQVVQETLNVDVSKHEKTKARRAKNHKKVYEKQNA